MLPDGRMKKAASDGVATSPVKAIYEDADRIANVALFRAFAALDRDALIEAGAQSAPAERVACRRWHERGECRVAEERLR